jgi:hypothetical protein
MRYFRIPIYENDKPDIADTDNFDLLFYIGDGKTVYGILIDGVVRPSWEEITEDDFERFTIMEQQNNSTSSFEESIMTRLEKMQEQLNTMEQTQAYMIGLQSGVFEDAMIPAEEEEALEEAEISKDEISEPAPELSLNV